MINTKYVVLIEDSDDVWNSLSGKFENEEGYQIVKSDSSTKSVKQAMLTLPDLIIINEDGIIRNSVTTLVDYLRKNDDYAITPLIMVSSNSDREHRLEMLRRGAEFYIKKPLHEGYFFYTIKNVSRLISANRCISALTGLPGNIQIENELKRKLASHNFFAVLYIDLDNFKAYNDKYGFMNGDEVIKFTSDVVQDSIQKYGVKGDFLGHIGGDDFVAVIDYENARKIGRDIVRQFDKGIKKFYTEDDIERGWIKVANRKGKLEKYPIMSLTVAMISNKYKKYSSTLEIGEDGACVKKKGKTVEGSIFIEDRRKTIE